MKTKYLRTEDGKDWFQFSCVGCRSEGELGIPLDMGMKPFACPEECGATYVRWTPGPPFERTPTLKCVVRPFFRTELKDAS